MKETVSLNVRQDLSEDNFEALFVDILFPKSQPFLVGVCYRPPSDSGFLGRFREIVSEIDPGIEAHILGDFNICIKQGRSSLARHYRGILDSFSFVQLIDQPTRITANSSSVLDHILTNSEPKVVKSGVMDLSLSDHQAVYFIRGAPANGGGGIPKIQKQRVMKEYSKERLHDGFCFSCH